MRFNDFAPKSIVCFREGYSKDYFFHDLFAGASVGVIALPLALAFAIASGVTPERGLFTAIIAGFLILNSGVEKTVGYQHMFNHIDSALAYAQNRK